jgi:hypothetical protein
MTTSLPKNLFFVLLLTACSSAKNNNSAISNIAATESTEQPQMAADARPASLNDLPQTQDGGFVLKPGFYEAEFKTYCLQPGTPDPRQGDAYLQGKVSGYRKEIVESVLLNSRDHSEIPQKNIQLLLWSVVSGSNFNSLSTSVQSDAMKLLTPKQIFELRGGVLGAIKNVSNATGILDANSDIKKLFEASVHSYEAYEKLAVRQEASRIVKPGVKADQWYKQKENYYVRYFPESYKKVRIQVYVPDQVLDSNHKLNNEYVVFDPTGQQAIPAYTNAQKLGIGTTVIDVVREVIKVNKPPVIKKKPANKKGDSKTETPAI